MTYRYQVKEQGEPPITSEATYDTMDEAWFAGKAATHFYDASWDVIDEQGNVVELDHDPFDPDGGDARDIQREQQRWRDINELGYIRPEHMSDAEWERERQRDKH